MKKILLIVPALFFITLIKAQSTHLGLKAGLNFAGLNVTNSPDYDAKTGFHVGALAHIHVTDHFAVQPEVVYSMEGGKIDEYKLKLNYLNVPILFQYMVANGFR